MKTPAKLDLKSAQAIKGSIIEACRAYERGVPGQRGLLFVRELVKCARLVLDTHAEHRFTGGVHELLTRMVDVAHLASNPEGSVQSNIAAALSLCELVDRAAGVIVAVQVQPEAYSPND
jgi:hypothetical protein